MKRLMLVAALCGLPTFASAQSSCSEKHAAEACMDGTQWNTETKACEKIVSS